MERLLGRKLTTTLRPFPSVPGGVVSMPSQDSEPPMAVASRWVSEITNIALQFCLPAGIGFWLDARWKTSPWLVVLGACLGLFVAGASFVQLVRRLAPPAKSPSSSSSEKTADDSGSSLQ